MESKKTINVEELKKIQLNILKHVDKFCQEHHIKYFMCGGSLIGTIRHKGFIPWDDDIDIMMLRDDYERFVSEYSANTESTYLIHSSSNDDGWFLPFAKIEDTNTILKEHIEKKNIIGINIDVFPIDNVPDNQNLQSAMYKTWRKWFNIHGLKLMSTVKERTFIKNAILVFFHLVLSLVPYKYLVKKIETNAMQYSNQKTKYCGIAVWGYGKKEINLKSNFEDVIMMPFEDITVPVPVGYDNYLTSVYGDYMMLPPAEKRTSHHDFEAWWKG